MTVIIEQVWMVTDTDFVVHVDGGLDFSLLYQDEPQFQVAGKISHAYLGLNVNYLLERLGDNAPLFCKMS